MDQRRMEMKSRFDARMHEHKRTLSEMKAKADMLSAERAATYHEHIAKLHAEHDELRERAAKAVAESDEAVDSAEREMDASLEEWESRAKRTMHGLTD